MRVALVAVRYAGDGAGRLKAAADSARVTHAHPLAVDAAVVQATAIAAALVGEAPLDAALAAATTAELRGRLSKAARLLDRSPEPAEAAAALGNRATGQESVPAAIYSAAAHPSVEAAMTFAVRCSGDTDTIGAWPARSPPPVQGPPPSVTLARGARGGAQGTQPRRKARRPTGRRERTLKHRQGTPPRRRPWRGASARLTPSRSTFRRIRE
jgi:ADP-ribosylglycohydrolase